MLKMGELDQNWANWIKMVDYGSSYHYYGERKIFNASGRVWYTNPGSHPGRPIDTHNVLTVKKLSQKHLV